MEVELKPIADKVDTTAYSLRLEALRGLAALMVVCFHGVSAADHPWARLVFNGSGAVSLFFVLSGYVLGLSLWRGTGSISRQCIVFFMPPGMANLPCIFCDHPGLSCLLENISVSRWRHCIAPLCPLATDSLGPDQEFHFPRAAVQHGHLVAQGRDGGFPNAPPRALSFSKLASIMAGRDAPAVAHPDLRPHRFFHHPGETFHVLPGLSYHRP